MAMRFEELCDSAFQSYKAGRKREAALLFQQARVEAERHGDRAGAFYATVWAGEAWLLAGKPLLALELTLDALRTVPQDADPFDVCVARENQLELIRRYRPDHAALTAAYNALERHFHETLGLPRADLHYPEGRLSIDRGDFAAALESFEQGWSVHRGAGFLKCRFAYFAMGLNLQLGLRDAAARWCRLLGQTDQDRQEVRVNHAVMRARLARFDGDLAALEAAASDAMSLAVDIDVPDWKADALAEMLRCQLLQPAYGDPAGPAHPACALLRQRSSGRLMVQTVYEWRLLVFDYRLACLRFAADVPAVEDEWYRTPQDLGAVRPAPGLTQAGLARRIDQARQAGRRALDYARYLDQCFACGWREDEVRGRLARLDAIAAALAPFLHSAP